MAETAAAVQEPPKEELARRDHLNEIDWSKYEAEDSNEYNPIRYFREKGHPENRLVRLISPGSEYPVVVRLPEKTDNPEVKAMIKRWEDIQHLVMLDKNTLKLLSAMAARYNERQPLIVEGPPAVSKTFAIWVFAAIIEAPYVRLSFSAGTRESQIIGSQVADRRETPKYGWKLMEKVLNSAKVQGDPLAKEIADTIKQAIAAGTPVQDFVEELNLVGSIIGVPLVESGKYVWQDTDLNKVVEHGGIGALDEPNTVEETGVLERLLPHAEVNTVEIGMPAQRGSKIDKHPDFWLVLAQNPPNVGARNPLTDAMESRHQKEVLANITEQYISDFLTFFMTGNDPEIRIKGKKIAGRTDVKTAYRMLENMPKRDAVVRALSKIHVLLCDFVVTKKIGLKRKDGGSYVFDQRDVAGLLDSIVGSINRKMVVETVDGLQAAPINWRFVIQEAVREVYMTGIQGSAANGDFKDVQAMVDSQPIWAILDAQDGVPGFAAGANFGVKKTAEGWEPD